MLCSRPAALVVSLVCVLSFASGVRAQSSDVRDEEARALFSAGRVAFEAGDYEHALQDFQQAYDRSPRPELLFNIGQAADRLRRDDEALAAYHRFLAEAPASDQRALVESRVAFLEQANAHEAATTTEEPTPEVSETTVDAAESTTMSTPTEQPPPPATPGIDPIGPIVLGVGGAVLVAGAILIGLGYSDRAAVETAADGTSWASVEGAYGRADSEATAGFVLLGVGAATAIAGAVLTGVLRTGGTEARVMLGPTGLSVRGTF